MRFLKALGKFLLVTVALFLTLNVVLLGASWLLFGPPPDCSETSPSVAYARSLSQETLAQLYLDMERYWATEKTPYAIGYQLGVQGEFVPEEFAQLKARKVRPEQQNIMLLGCLDEFVYLQFDGFSSDSEHATPRRIVLQYNVSSYKIGEEILWEEGNSQRPHE